LMAPNGERLGVVGFADMSGFTQFVAAAGDLQGADMAARLEEVVAGTLDRSAGRIIKAMGDGLLIHFPRAEAAVPAAVAIVDAARAAGLLPVHVGLAAGTVLFRDGDIFGATVNRAARLAGQANPGCVLVDEAVRGLSGGSGGQWETVHLGPLKGLAEIPAFRWMPYES
ncbi:MAG: adenylate/guanylate cyclase domain-containing protein, partial [Rhodospirillaceae bacterium]|nr:adenylate/guanylate cyclase domain-containing protein [Rhodospirillaceae bacterium]